VLLLLFLQSLNDIPPLFLSLDDIPITGYTLSNLYANYIGIIKVTRYTTSNLYATHMSIIIVTAYSVPFL